MADTPTIIDCADIAAEATRLRALFTPCYALTAADLDDLVSLAYSASLCGTTTGLDQDNIAVLKYSSAITNGTATEAAAAVNAMADFTVGEKELAIFRMWRQENGNTKTPTQQYHDYWLLKDVGKGSYGTAGTQIDQSNMFFLRSTLGFTLPTIGDAVVYDVYTDDISDAPAVILNGYSNGSGYVVSSGADYYFKMIESTDKTVIPQDPTKNYSLYRWVGSNGHYGADGVDSSVALDFELVETFDGNDSSSSGDDNIITTIYTATTTSTGLTAAAAAVNASKEFDVSDKENILFRVPRQQQVTKLASYMYYDYYLFLNKGKGTYGSGATAITSTDLFLVRSTEVYSITTDEDLPPVVHEIRTDDISTPPQDVLNGFENTTGYLVQNNEDSYFEIKETVENLTAKTDTPTYTGNYKLYRFTGAAGTYGADGVDTAVLGDFTLIETNDAGNPKGLAKRTIDAIEVINGTNVASDSISKAVNRDYWGDIVVNVNDLLFFRTLRKVVNTDDSIAFLEETYHYTGGEGVISADSTDDDFVPNSSRLITAPITNAQGNDTKVHGISAATSTAPEDGVNNSASTFTIDSSTYDTYFVSNTNKISTNNYTIYEFTGANGTYGTGGAQTAVFGDFTAVTTYDDDITTPYATSQLFNDGENGVNPFITLLDVTTSIDPTGLELLTEGGNDGWRLIGRTAVNFGDIGVDSIDFSTSDVSSSAFGTTGDRSITSGFRAANPYHETLMIGRYLNGASTNGYSSGNIIVGDGTGSRQSYFYNNLYSNVISVFQSSVGTSGADLNTAVVYNSLIAGNNLLIEAAKDALIVGQGLVSGASSCAVVGQGNVDLTQTVATQLTSTGQAYNPRFIVGTGNWNSDSNSGSRANGLVVWSDGGVVAPSQTPALIASYGDESLITKEYGDLNYLSSVGLEGYEYTGTVVGLDLVVQIGAPLSGQPTYIEIDDAANSIELTAQSVNAQYVSPATIDLTGNRALTTVEYIEERVGIFTKTITVTAAELKTLGTTPVVLIPSVSGKFIRVESVLATMTYGSVAFDANAMTVITVGAGNEMATFASALISATTDQIYLGQKGAFGADVILYETNVILDGTDSVATGDSDITFYISYELIGI
tara:strand:- start:524 stop:3868 length:3345 start_codon:yes stop_codon:yes gene_type:complete